MENQEEMTLFAVGDALTLPAFRRGAAVLRAGKLISI